jgi:hypothetical protein
LQGPKLAMTPVFFKDFMYIGRWLQGFGLGAKFKN